MIAEPSVIPVGGGVLPVDKPAGPTSFAVIRAVRRILGLRAAGHAGTLDPMASGLLVVCVGPATRLTDLLMAGAKTYRATVRLGVETDTDDAAGHPVAEAPIPALTRALVEAALSSFVGEIMQVPPAYSAITRGGQPLYRKARRGAEVRLEARPVTVHRIEILGLGEDGFDIEVECGKGTYIRALARDLGLRLGTRGHLASLRRTRCSGFGLEDAIRLEDLERASPLEAAFRLIPPVDALPWLPRLMLGSDDLERVRHGRAVDARRLHPEGATVLLVSPAGTLAAVAAAAGGRLRPRRVFPS